MVHIVFEYKDQFLQGKWSRQECTCESVEACKKFYGLGVDPDCEYRIISLTYSHG